MNIQQLLQWATREIEESSPSPQLDALVIIAHALSVSKEALLTHPEREVSKEGEAGARALIKRRLEREPVAYILGTKEFWGLPFRVGPGVLIPRPETELLVELAVQEVVTRAGGVRCVELGVGSGCVVCSLVHEAHRRGRVATVLGVERSAEAYSIAQANVTALGVAGQVELLHADWNDLSWSEPFDIVVSNPPYLRIGDTRRSPETAYEPGEALFAGESGLEAIDSILKILPTLLKPDGAAFIEIGSEQAPESVSYPKYGNYTFKTHRDLSGNPRVIELRFPSMV